MSGCPSSTRASSPAVLLYGLYAEQGERDSKSRVVQHHDVFVVTKGEGLPAWQADHEAHIPLGSTPRVRQGLVGVRPRGIPDSRPQVILYTPERARG